TLAIIAYRQPTTRGEIEALRGLKVSSNIIASLQERGWIKVLGRKEVPGRPHLYGTGKQFLIDFELNSLTDLPDSAQLMDEEEIQQIVADNQDGMKEEPPVDEDNEQEDDSEQSEAYEEQQSTE
ncbi:MAG TPA: SMC-Scp complex subunit ScpB, partial [Mariprofundaceae bacterium]|nr:SMC-Scp complex subunit ScpB [Mariprofundaceae bacterium]